MNQNNSDKSNNAHENNSHNQSHHHHHHHKERERVAFSVDKSDENIPVAKYSKKKKDDKEKKKKSKVFKFFVTLGIIIISLLLILIVTFGLLLLNGKSSMVGSNQDADEHITPPANVQTTDDYIVYNGEKYKYNSKVTTILFAGIDKRNKEHLDGVLGTAGQADAIFVIALNTETGKYRLMSVSRDSMVDVNTCDAAGNFLGTKEMQICLAHAYGDGKETSNENLKRSVSRLFFGIPVNAYMSVDLDVIPILNDAVGGVNVDVIEDLTEYDPVLKKGANVTLNGKQAEIYVRARDVNGDENQNNLRMERQKSFLTSFINQTISLTKQDPMTPISLYNGIADYTRTDIGAAKITYLSSVFVTNGFSSDEDYIKVPGETVMGEKYAEYHVDTDEFFKIILDTYYTKVTD